VPRLVKVVFIDYVGRFLGINISSAKSIGRGADSILLNRAGDDNAKMFLMGVLILLEKQLRGAALKKSLELLEGATVNESEDLETIREDWTNVARAIDRLLFWIFLLLTLMTGFLFFL
jgi:hypothetical protein